jgi:hypothetical protein
MTMTIDANELIVPTLPIDAKTPRGGGARRKTGPRPAPDPAAGLGKARAAIEKLEEQNHKAANVLQSMTNLWLSVDAKRRRGEAEMALNHFEDALIALRKSLAAT